MNVCGVTFGDYLAKILSFKLGNLLYKSNFYLLSEGTVHLMDFALKNFLIQKPPCGPSGVACSALVFWQSYLETNKEMTKRNNKTHKKCHQKCTRLGENGKRKQFALIWLGIEIGPCSHDGLSGHKFVKVHREVG